MLALGCSNTDKRIASMHNSAAYYNYLNDDFDNYLLATQQWLANNRSFISNNHQQELVMNMPFTAGNATAEKAILLVHGLGDSPFSFADIATSLAKQGFYVQVLLLPGHGSDPGHMQGVEYEDWQRIVDHYASLLKANHQQVWLGGFSTGGNLVSIHAMENGDVSGLLLFSPGFKTLTPVLEKFTPLVALFTDGWTAVEDNLAKYNSAPIASALAYSKSAAVFRDKIAQTQISIPTLMVVSEADSIIDAKALNGYFKDKFTHPQSHLIWYGDEKQVADNKRAQAYSMQRDDLRVSTASHMSILFAPENHYYGQHGQKRICENSFNKTHTNACNAGEPVWFSAWGYTQKHKVHARLTWNPYFNELLLKYCSRFYDRQFITRSNLNNAQLERFNQFLQGYYQTDRPQEAGIPTVQYCGQELGVSPYYLSDLLKKETGKNALEHIHLFLIERAKTQLCHSKLSITQIAYDLGFEYPQHFSKLFKAKTGLSPRTYRSNA